MITALFRLVFSPHLPQQFLSRQWSSNPEGLQQGNPVFTELSTGSSKTRQRKRKKGDNRTETEKHKSRRGWEAAGSGRNKEEEKMAEIRKEGGSAIKRKRNCGQEVYTKEKSGRGPHRHIGGPSTKLLPLILTCLCPQRKRNNSSWVPVTWMSSSSSVELTHECWEMNVCFWITMVVLWEISWGCSNALNTVAPMIR